MNDLVRKITVITNSNNVTDNGIQDATVTSGGPSYEEMKHNSGPTTGTDNATGQQSDISNEVN